MGRGAYRFALHLRSSQSPPPEFLLKWDVSCSQLDTAGRDACEGSVRLSNRHVVYSCA